MTPCGPGLGLTMASSVDWTRLAGADAALWGPTAASDSAASRVTGAGRRW